MWTILLAVVAVSVSYAIGANIGGKIGSEIAVANSDVAPMDADLCRDYMKRESEIGMSTEEKIAYIRGIREYHDSDGILKANWSEADMLRELQYHETGYNILVDLDIESSFVDRLADVDFEERQTFKTYTRRFLGNVLNTIRVFE